jgi:hypothetical protein
LGEVVNKLAVPLLQVLGCRGVDEANVVGIGVVGVLVK